MDEQDQAIAASPVQPDTALTLEIEADATLGYASIQNAIPVVRAIRLHNPAAEAVEKIEVLISCNPSFARGMHLRFERLAPGESRSVSPLDLQPDHAFLSDLNEGLSARIDARVLASGQELANTSRAVEVLAYDQWAGTRALPELLAAFCMPNNPAIDELIGKASKLLRAQHSELSMNGYQSKSRDVVWKQVSALYSAIAAESLQYAEPPASFTSDGQKIRTPDRILEGRVATCLDLAMLFASCLEQAGLRPVILMKEGHAWVGVWLHEACFPDPLTDDVQAVRKRVDSGELLVFETTAVAHHQSHRPSLRIAMEQGQEHLLDEQAFGYAIDIHRARELQIRALPSRHNYLSRQTAPETEAPPAIEPTPQLPPLDPELLAPIDVPVSDTPEGRLASWKSKLLDLTLRNRLLNFKSTKSTLALIAPDLGRFEDALADGLEFTIRALPELMEGSDPRMAEVHMQRSGKSPVEQMALQALANKELLVRVPQTELDGRLLEIHNTARTNLEEGGANTLYLALGFLRWTEVAKAETTQMAPILLVPVTLTRQSVRSGFRLHRHDDETIVNPTLLQLLRTKFELNLPGMDTPPTDDKGVDVAKVLQTFRLAVREIAQWEVLEQACLGIFSFTKFLMWKDLQDRTEQLKGNRVVKHLIEHPGEAFAREGGGEAREHLDDFMPQEILAPLLMDSSQLRALCAVDSGHDLVLEGPPGTGKSQTITNLIAHSLAKGKTVLFVSEKMAALEVVHRRLSQIGLGPFCLELHSSKAKKTEVIQQLGKVLEIAAERTVDDWDREAERLQRLRGELNDLVAALHKDYPNGLTVFDAIGTCISHAGEEASRMPWADPLTHDRDALDTLRETTRRMAAMAGDLGQLQGHPLSQIGHAEWSPSWQDELLEAASALDRTIQKLRDIAATIERDVGIPTRGLDLQSYREVDRLADVMLAAPKVPVGVARAARDPGTQTKLRALAQHGQARAAAWKQVGEGWTAALAKLNAVELQASWSQANAAWWPKAVFAKRAMLNKLSSFRDGTKRPTAQQVGTMLTALPAVNDEDQFLRSMQADAEALLDEQYRGIDTPWESLAHYQAWAQSFQDAVVRVSAGQPEPAWSTRLHALVGSGRALLDASAPVGSALLAYRDTWREFEQGLRKVEELARPTEPLQGPARAQGALERIQGILNTWRMHSRQLQPWSLWRKVRDAAIAQGLQDLVLALETGQVPLAGIVEHFEFSYQNWWLKKTIDREPALREFSSADHERKIREFRAADERFQHLTEAYIRVLLSQRVPTMGAVLTGVDTEYGRLKRELQKQRRHMPIRQLMQGLPSLLPRLKPCLLMSPLSVAQYLDAGYAPFDLVVFDEASQIAVWDAVGAIARGRQLVVVGDPKQLPPTNFFAKASQDDEDAPDMTQVHDLESILDECLGAGMNQLSLEWHYRSRHESLITFSNAHYYESRLITFPSPVTDDVAVRLERVQGTYDRGGSRTNQAEATAIVSAIEKHYLDKTRSHQTVGVVTFNQPQQSLINNLLDARRRANPALDRAIAAHASEPLFVKNLENVQGDERDLILFSITYGQDAAGRMTMNFGPLNGEGGHRRLNVAISRAREGVVIYSSLLPEHIDLSRVRAAGVRDLKHYLEFALRGPRALVEQAIPLGLEPDSPFEAAVIRLLRERGWTVHPQVGCSGYRVDIGVVDPRAPGRYLAGIECDGRTYHSGATARDRDRLRQLVLEGLGWRIYRIWSTDWWLNPEREMEKVAGYLEQLLAQEAEDAAEDEAGDADATATAPSDAEQAGHVEQAGAAPLHSETAPLSTAKAPAAEIYTVLSLPGGNPGAFYEPANDALLTQQLRDVIDAQGPIAEAVLLRQIARAWGLERTGSRIVERLRQRLPAGVRRTREGDNQFLWPAPGAIADLPAPRIADGHEESRRHVDDVCTEELAAIVLLALKQYGAMPQTDTCRAVCRLLGMARMPTEAESRVARAMDKLSADGRIQRSGGLTVLAPGSA